MNRNIKTRISWAFYNSFTGEEYISCSGAPYDRVKASYGYYSALMKKYRRIQAKIYEVDVRFVKFKFNVS